MLCQITAALLLAANVAVAAPFASATLVARQRIGGAWNESAFTQEIQIHESCNDTQQAFLRDGIEQMNAVSRHAIDRTLRNGVTDELYIRYFGSAPASSAVGFYTQLMYGDKSGVLLRCDNPDGNCALVSERGPWAGHWRGENATQETVICPPTYTSRFALDQLCKDDNIIGVANPSDWLSTDLMHRMTHIPTIFGETVEHVSDSYAGCLELAATNNTLAAFNQNTFQYYALDAYARDIAAPHDGCAISPEEAMATMSAATVSSVDAGPTSAAATAEPSVDIPAVGAAGACHTHADGVEHGC